MLIFALYLFPATAFIDIILSRKSVDDVEAPVIVV